MLDRVIALRAPCLQRVAKKVRWCPRLCIYTRRRVRCIVTVGRRDGGRSEQQERVDGSASFKEDGDQRGIIGDTCDRDCDHGTVHHESRRRVHQREDH